jgi:hypothetical protein
MTRWNVTRLGCMCMTVLSSIMVLDDRFVWMVSMGLWLEGAL